MVPFPYLAYIHTQNTYDKNKTNIQIYKYTSNNVSTTTPLIHIYRHSLSFDTYNNQPEIQTKMRRQRDYTDYGWNTSAMRKTWIP